MKKLKNTHFELWERHWPEELANILEDAALPTWDLIHTVVDEDTRQFKCMAGFVHFGCKVIPISTEAERLLLQTDLSTVTPEDIGYMPNTMLWPSYYMALENSELTLFDEHTGVHKLAGFYVMFSTTQLVGPDGTPHDTPGAAWELLLCGHPNGLSVTDDTLYSFTLPICFDAPMSEIVELIPGWSEAPEANKACGRACVAMIAGLSVRYKARGKA